MTIWTMVKCELSGESGLLRGKPFLDDPVKVNAELLPRLLPVNLLATSGPEESLILVHKMVSPGYHLQPAPIVNEKIIKLSFF